MKKSKRIESKGVIFVGSNDITVGTTTKQLFPDHDVFIMDSDIYNQTADKFIKKSIKWREDQAIHVWKTKKENIEMAHEMMSKLLATVGEGYFQIKDIVEGTNMSYKQVMSMVDVLFVFGLIAKKEEDGREIYLIINDPIKKQSYLKDLIDVRDKETESLEAILRQVDIEVVNWTEEQLKKKKESEENTNSGDKEIKPLLVDEVEPGKTVTSEVNGGGTEEIIVVHDPSI